MFNTTNYFVAKAQYYYQRYCYYPDTKAETFQSYIGNITNTKNAFYCYQSLLNHSLLYLLKHPHPLDPENVRKCKPHAVLKR